MRHWILGVVFRNESIWNLILFNNLQTEFKKPNYNRPPKYSFLHYFFPCGKDKNFINFINFIKTKKICEFFITYVKKRLIAWNLWFIYWPLFQHLNSSEQISNVLVTSLLSGLSAIQNDLIHNFLSSFTGDNWIGIGRLLFIQSFFQMCNSIKNPRGKEDKKRDTKIWHWCYQDTALRSAESA